MVKSKKSFIFSFVVVVIIIGLIHGRWAFFGSWNFSLFWQLVSISSTQTVDSIEITHWKTRWPTNAVEKESAPLWSGCKPEINEQQKICLISESLMIFSAVYVWLPLLGWVTTCTRARPPIHEIAWFKKPIEKMRKKSPVFSSSLLLFLLTKHERTNVWLTPNLLGIQSRASNIISIYLIQQTCKMIRFFFIRGIFFNHFQIFHFLEVNIVGQTRWDSCDKFMGILSIFSKRCFFIVCSRLFKEKKKPQSVSP